MTNDHQINAFDHNKHKILFHCIYLQLNGECIKVLEGHDRFVTSCGFSPDGKLLASGQLTKKWGLKIFKRLS